ncbi:MAG: amidohydrolase family protein [Candidatus Aenigmarchaeota archaeon]|nr:amidohydrolase family protein [Candidatus Aenigmarchaeota archaeon]
MMNFKSFWIILLPFLLLVNCSENKIIAFQNVNLVPMTEEKIVENQTVLIRGNKIIQIGPSNNTEAPRNSKIINGEGTFLMPGLTDMHMHTRDDWLSPVWPVSPLNLYLANGVTTIRCFGPLGSSPNYILHWRDEINNGNLIGPTIYTCGSVLYGPVKDPEGMVQEQKNRDFDFIKIYSFVSQDEFHKAVHKAKSVGIYTAGHIPFSVGLDGVLSEGMDEIAHIEELDFEFLDFDGTKKVNRIELFRYIIDTAIQQHKKLIGLDIEGLEERYGKTISATIDKLRTVNIPICTTLVVGEGIVKKLHETEAFLKRSENKYLPEGYMDTFRQGKEKHQVIFKGFEDFAIFKYTLERLLLIKLKKAGITLLLSTDAGTGGMGIVPGFSIHDELQILTENGFTSYEAIATGTVNAARTIENMTGVGDFGTVEVGNRADLILVNENPLEDVRNIRDLRGVMVGGRWYDKTELQKMINITD